jgi:hypothetical protein
MVSSKKLISSFDHLIILMETAFDNPMLTSTQDTIEARSLLDHNTVQSPNLFQSSQFEHL